MGACVWYISKYVAPPGKGAAGGRGYLLMKELAGAGDKVVIIASDSNHLAEVPGMEEAYLYQFIDGIHFCWVRTFKYRVAKSVRRILSWLHFEWRVFWMPKASLPAPDVVVVSSLSLLTVLNGLLLRRRYGCRLVFEVRDIWPLTLVAEGGFRPANPFVKLLAFVEHLGYKRADAVVGTMPNLGEHVKNVLGYERPVACIPMGFDPGADGEISPLPDEYVREFIPMDKFVVAHVGSIGITNALDTFLECAVQLSGRTEIQFLLVGDGDLRDDYRDRYGHLPNLTFAEKVRKEQVQSVLRHCDVLYFAAHPSEVWTYGQSLNKLVDYMLAGKPIVASYTGFPSMINEADCGRFVPSGDVQALAGEILRVAELPAEARAEMGQRGRQWLMTHRTYGSLARKYRAILLPGATQVRPPVLDRLETGGTYER